MLGAGFAMALAALAGGPAPDLDDCAARVTAAPDVDDGYRCFRDVANRTGVHAEAFDRAAGFLAVDPDNSRARWALAGLDTALGGKRSEALYEEAIRGLHETGATVAEARARLEWAGFLQRAGRSEDAETHLAAAREIAARTGDESLVADLNIQEAWQAFRRSDRAEAAAKLEGVRPWIESVGTPAQRAAWLAARGAIAWAMARWDEALSAYEDEARVHEAAGNAYDEAAARANIVLLSSQRSGRGDPTEDDRRVLDVLLGRAADAARRGGNQRILGSVALYRAQLTRDTVEARVWLDQAIERLARGGDLSNRLVATRYLAEVLALQDPRDPVRSRALLDEAIRLAHSHGDLDAVVRGRIVEASLAWRLGEPAYDSSDRALEAIEAIRDLQLDEGVRAGVHSQWGFFYDRLLGYLLRPPGKLPTRREVEKAFEIAERMRARVLLERLDTVGVPLADPRHADLLAERHRAIEAAARLRVELSSPFLDDDRRVTSLARFEEYRREEDRLRGMLAAADPRFEMLRAPPIPPLGEVEAALGPHQAILAFTTGSGATKGGYIGGGSWLLVHASEGTRVYPVPPEEELLAETALYAGLFESRDGAEGTAGVRLYDVLLRAALGSLDADVTQLLIVPDGPLHRVPFAALRDRVGGPPLAERFALTSSPSVAAWLRWKRAESEPMPPAALIVADPWVDSREIAEDRNAEKALPYARIEASRATKRLPGRSQILEGSRATESSLKSATFERFGVLHVAAHARLEDERAGEACILLAPGGDGEDGRLTVAEASALDLHDRVVVLAACRTAGGPFVEGEGVLSLSRGFLVAGARAVIGSLWPLRDDETVDFFDAFYRRLGEGAAVADAFAGAQRDRIAAGAAASAWAGLVLIGDGTVRLEPPGLVAPTVLLAMAFAAGCLLWVLRRGRART